MKGALGNALIMNMVIVFIVIFYTMLIGSMAYSKAYKIKNYLINLIEQEETAGNHDFGTQTGKKLEKWDKKANEYLKNVGYHISTNQLSTCPKKEGYNEYISNTKGRYDYCIYRSNRTGDIVDTTNHPTIRKRYNYMVLVYMKFDVPVLGSFLKLPITGETKSYTVYR